MTSHRAVLAIDQGTSGTKAVVVDPEAGVLASVTVDVRAHHGDTGSVETDPEALLDSVVSSGRAALERAGRPVGAVCLANQGETVVAWDRSTGRALAPAVGWQDRRSQPLVEAMADSRDLVEERTGLVLDPYFSAPKLAWLRGSGTGEGNVTGGVIGTSDSWLIDRLCGAFVTDASTASRSLLTTLGGGGWDPDLVAAFGLQDEQLPRIVDSDEIVGVTAAFGPELPVTGLIVDQQAALLGQACIEPADAKCTFGTGAFLLANVGASPRRSVAGLAASVAWRLRGSTTYCLDGQVYAAASVVRWLIGVGALARAEDLDTVAAADAGSVLCVPALAGLAAPWWRPAATASITGLTLSSGSAELVLAALQGIAAQVAGVLDAASADLGHPIRTLRVDGGLTRCRALMQATADIAQVDVDISADDNATALGAATAGRLAMDPTLSLADAVPVRRSGGTISPAWSADRAADFRARWHALADRTSR